MAQLSDFLGRPCPECSLRGEHYERAEWSSSYRWKCPNGHVWTAPSLAREREERAALEQLQARQLLTAAKTAELAALNHSGRLDLRATLQNIDLPARLLLCAARLDTPITLDDLRCIREVLREAARDLLCRPAEGGPDEGP